MKYTIILFTMISYFTLHAQTQIGDPIFTNNPTSAEAMGLAVALNSDGTVVAAGAPFWTNTSGGQNSGRVTVFELDANQNWIQKGSQIETTPALAGMGLTVDLSDDGNILAVGAPFYTLNLPRQGLAQVYEFIDGDWVLKGQEFVGTAAGDRFGAKVNLSGDGTRLVFGAYQADSNGLVDSGLVRAYEFDEATNQWVQMGSDISGNEGERMGFCTFSNYGTRIAAHSQRGYSNSIETSEGSVSIFEWDGSDWVQMGETLYGDMPGDQFGYEMDFDLNAEKLVASSRVSNSDTGYVKLFTFDGTNWVQTGSTLYGQTSGEAFGTGLAINGSGTGLAVGAPKFANAGFADQGIVRFYTFDGTNWLEGGTPISNVYPNVLVSTGIAIDIAVDENITAIGSAFFHNNELDINPGAVQVFDVSFLNTDDIQTFSTGMSVVPSVAKTEIEIIDSENNSIKQVSFYNAEGRMVNANSLNGQKYNVSHLNSGVYFIVVVLENNEVQYLKFIKE